MLMHPPFQRAALLSPETATRSGPQPYRSAKVFGTNQGRLLSNRDVSIFFRSKHNVVVEDF